ncbi:MAG: tetratricopeptide repeat-containing sensor histidine kinase [Bernardetiaceae bacterium]|jgi:signal transduction histidine kinase|nr:tetratricopeptide repeat-containing sensor histidine kinase [Bernardetiaceae bacterium]
MTIRSLLILCSGLLFFREAHAQSPFADTLAQTLATLKTPQEKVDHLNNCLSALRERNLQQAVALNRATRELAQKHQYRRGEGIAYYFWASVLILENEYDSAIWAAKRSAELLLPTGDSVHIAHALNNEAVAHKFLGNYQAAMNLQIRALSIRKNQEDVVGMSLSYNNIGDLYSLQDNQPEAIGQYQQGLALAQAAHDSTRIILNLVDLGRACYLNQESGRAVEYYQQALQLGARKVPSNKIAEAEAYLAEAYSAQGKYELAIRYLNQSLARSQSTQNRQNELTALYQTAQVYEKMNRLPDALAVASPALDKANQAGMIKSARDLSFLLSRLHQKQGNAAQALVYHQKYHQFHTKIEAESYKKGLSQLKSQHELAQAKQTNHLLQREQEVKSLSLQRSYFILGAVGLALLVTIPLAVFLYHRSKQRKLDGQRLARLNRALELRQAEIHRLNENLERLVGERTTELSHTVDQLTAKNQDLQQFSYILSHNIKSPIAQIAGLLELFKMEHAHLPVNQEILGHLETAVRNLDTVIRDLNDILTISRGVEKTQEEVWLNQVVHQALQILDLDVKRAQAQITTDFGAGQTVYGVKFYIQSVVYNLISNAIKYRSPQRLCQVHISTTQTEAWVCLSVRDNGLGINLKNTDPYKIFGLYQRMHTHTEGKGLGLYLVKTQMESMNGRIEVQSELDQGSEFKVYWPVVPLAAPEVPQAAEVIMG